MSNSSNNRSTESFFGEVISTYTRAQAVEDGVLIDAGGMAQEAGFKWPVAITADAWADSVAWSEDDSEKQVYQDQSGRLWDVLFSAT
jgi:type I site-specific restriction endonuclease